MKERIQPSHTMINHARLRLLLLVVVILRPVIAAVVVLAKGEDFSKSSRNFDSRVKKISTAATTTTTTTTRRKETRILQQKKKSPDPTDHYFCGRGFNDASKSCEYPCPSGLLTDCPSGMLCYYDTPCDLRDIPGPPTAKPFDPNLWRPPSQAPWRAGDPRLSNYCGVDWGHASENCQVWCPDADENTCPYGQSCFTSTTCEKKIDDVPNMGLWYAPSQAPWAKDDRRLTFFCGTSWSQAGQACGTWCPDADDTKCPYGQSCFSDTTCKHTPEPTLEPTMPPPTRKPTQRPTGPTQSPTASPVPLLPEDLSNNMFCGNDWQQAATTCSLEKHCGGDNGGCNSHEACWHGVLCDVRDFIPAQEGGKLGRPTHKEIAEKMGLTWPSDDPTDHYFCGLTMAHASKSCTRPCPNGLPIVCSHGEYCFENTECDYRVTPGYGLTKPPTQRPTEPRLPHGARENTMFCGWDWSHANTCEQRWCGAGDACPEGQSCYADLECNIQDRPPPPPSFSPTHSPVPYDHKTNFFFCGASYTEALDNCSIKSHCKGDHSECGPGNYCWAGVACNIQDLTAPSPTRTAEPTRLTPRPSKSPSAHHDPRNSRFCGISWSDASLCPKKHDGSSARWCPRGSDEECSDGETCWADTMCNMMDFTMPPTDDPTDRPTETQTWFPTETPIEYNDPINISFCGFSYMDAQENCSVQTHCPSGLTTGCPSGDYCWTVSKPGCNILDFVSTSPLPLSQTPTELPSRIPTKAPLIEYNDPINISFCGFSYMEAQENCSIRTHCPSGLRTDCPGGFCWTVSKPGCNILDFASASLPLSQTPTEFPSRILLPTRAPLYSPTAEPTEKPTGSVLTDSDERNSLYCGTSWSDANSKCKVECPFMTGCPPGETCFNTECSISPTNEQIPDPIETITSSPVTLAPTNPLETPYPTPYPISEETGPPTFRPSPNPTAGPTNKPTSKSAVATVPNPPTAGPTMSPKSGVRIAYFPNAETAVPKPPTSYAQRIQRIVQSIQPSFEDEIFVVELRSGAQVQSNLYTFNGFLKSLEFYTQLGVNDKYLYLGQDNSRSGTETFDDGIANLALFLAKMMDTIAHERCDPDKISCGFPALDSIFEEQNLRVECSPSSSDAEMNCPAQSGCVCILGILNHKITDGKYSGVDFCDSNRLQSICSRRTDQGEELRWIAAMSHWVFFVQQYNEEWNYLEELRNFVRGGMVDLTFVGTVAGLSVLDTETTTYLDSSNRKFEQNFFKAMIKLSEGMSQPYSQEPEMTTVRPTPKPVQYLAQTSGSRTTSPPTEDFTSINNLNGEPTDKPVSAMGWYEELGLGAGDNSSPSSISSASGFAPSAGVSQLPASSSPVSAGVVTSTENSHLPGVSAGHSSFPPSVTYVTATGENSQSPVFSADSPLSPVPAGIATAAEDGQMPTMSSDYISTLPVSIGDATTTENYKTTTSPAGYNPPPLISAEGNAASGEHPVLSSGDSSPSHVSAYDATEANDGKPPALYPSSTVAGSSSSVSPSPIPRQHWEYEDVPWYRGYVTGHSRGTRSRVSDCIRIIMVVTFCSFMF